MPDFTDLLPAEEILDEPLETEVDETEPIDEDTTVEPSEDEAEPTEESDEPIEDEPQPVGDGKTIPAELKELMKLHPDRAKLLKDLYFTNSRYNKFGKVADLQKLQDYVNSYGSFEEAQKVKEQLDSVGDLNGLVESHQTYEKLNQQYASADPAYVDHLAKSNPEAFSKIAPSFLQRFGSDHPEQYNYLMSQVVMSTLINNGTANALSLLGQAAASGNVEQVKQLAAQITDQIGHIQQLSQRAPSVRTADPRVAELEKREAALKAERQTVFAEDVKERANVMASPMIETALKPYGKLRPELLKRLDRDTKEEIGNILSQNTQFQQKIKQAFSKGDRESALRLYRQFVTPLVNGAARKVAGEYGLKAASKRGVAPTSTSRPAQTGRSQNVTSSERGFERVTQYPGPKDVNRDIPNYYELAAKDMFVLKDGRKIKVVS